MDPYSIKLSWKTKKAGEEGPDELIQLNETEETWQLNAIHGPTLKIQKIGPGSIDKLECRC